MSFKVIESRDNKTYKELLKLRKGDSISCRFLIEGEDLLEEARRENLLETMITFENVESDIDTIVLKKELYRELSSYQSLPKVMGIARKEMANISSLGDRVIYLDKIQDPGNCGTMIRTALSFSYTGVLLSPDSVSLYNSKVIQSSKGAIFHIPVCRGELSVLKDMGYNIFLTTLDGDDESKIKSLESPSVIAFGNEGQGISKKNLNLGKKIKIEMNGIDSLNVAVASGIFMYRFKK